MKKQKVHSRNTKPFNDIFCGIILFLLIALTPAIVMYINVPLAPEQKAVVSTILETVDLFSFFKSLFLIFCSLLISGFFIFALVRKKLDVNFKIGVKNPANISIIIFVFFVLLSAMLSPYRVTSIIGIQERFEGVFALLSYIVVFYAAWYYATPKNNPRDLGRVYFLMYGLMISSTIVSVIGVFQFLGMDYFASSISTLTVFLQKPDGNAYLTPRFVDQVYSTLYNPNCVGAYTALLLPFCISCAIYTKEKPVLRIWLAVNSITLFVCFIGARSSGSLLGAAFAVLVVAVTLVTCIVKSKVVIKPAYIVAFAGSFIAVVLAIAVVPSLRSHFGTMIEKLAKLDSARPEFPYKDLLFSDNSSTIVTQTGQITLTYDREEKVLNVYDQNGNLVPDTGVTESKDADATFTHYDIEGFGFFDIMTKGSAFAYQAPGMNLLFAAANDGNGNVNLYPLSSVFKVIDPNEPIPSFDFKGKEHWGSGRGYIWQKTIPLLWDYFIVGSGPDTFLLSFPQYDVQSKIRYFGDPYVLVDKAHNLFFMTGVNTGTISMLALLFLFGYYIVTTFKKLIKTFGLNKSIFGFRLGAMAGIAGYVVASMFTDSTVSVSPVAWFVLGLGFALNGLSEIIPLKETGKESGETA